MATSTSSAPFGLAVALVLASSVGCGSDATETAADAGADAATDAGADAATDAGADAATDAGPSPGGCLSLFDELSEPLERMIQVGPELEGDYLSISSPRSHDLDGDGCVDFVFGAGLEFVAGAVSAVSGSSGAILWTRPVRGEPFASPVFRARSDGSVQVVIGGRDGTLVSLDGATGSIEWEADPTVFGEREDHFNFYTPQWVEDVTGDGAPDLLVIHGGDVRAGPTDPRDPSWVALVDSVTGDVVARRLTPDLAESYASPVLLYDADERPESGTVFVFGTGGETLPGSLYIGTVAELLEPTTDEHWGREITAGTNGKGVIAPVLVADLDEDGERDLVVVDLGGRVSLYRGPEFDSAAWTRDFAGEESYSMAAPLRGPGGTFALAVSHSRGVYPTYSRATHRLLDAADGAVIESFESLLTNSPSPIALDLDGDGSDELIAVSSSWSAPFQSEFLVVDMAREETETFQFPYGMGATPLVHVAEGHDQMELVVIGFAAGDEPTDQPLEWHFRRLALDALRPDSITWGGYMGNCGTGRFPCERD